jgi:hypothetical protein
MAIVSIARKNIIIFFTENSKFCSSVELNKKGNFMGALEKQETKIS